MNKHIVPIATCVTAIALFGCKSTELTKPLSQYTPNEYLLHIKDNVDDGLINLGSLNERTRDGDGYTSVRNGSCGSSSSSKDAKKIKELWSQYCSAKGGTDFKRHTCFNQSNEVIFFTETKTNLNCEGVNNTKRFTTEIILPTNGLNYKGYISKIKSHGFETDKEIAEKEALRIKKDKEAKDTMESILNVGKEKHLIESPLKVKGGMVCRNVVERKINEYNRVVENKGHVHIIKAFVEDNTNNKVKVSIASITSKSVEQVLSTNDYYKNIRSVNAPSSAIINNVAYTKGQNLWDDSTNWYLCD